MIDGERRNQLAALIRRYLDDQFAGPAEINDFDEQLLSHLDCDDAAVRYVAETHLNYYEDDTAELTKQLWDHIQRLLLLLDSHSTVWVKYFSRLSWTQPVAALLFFACLFIALETGISGHLFVCFIPLGMASIWLAFCRLPEQEVGPFDAAVTPFHSIADLRIAYESANFVKKRCPFPSQRGKGDDTNSTELGSVLFYSCWASMPLIPLLIQCFPDYDCEIKVQPA